jgi:hypothetical protein
MIISNMSEESKSFEKEIQVLEQDVDDLISEKLYNGVRTPLPEDYLFKGKSAYTFQRCVLNFFLLQKKYR